MARILIVDDEQSNLDVATIICRSAGHEVIQATSGRQALQALEHAYDGGTPVDLVLTDVVMPEMDGMSFAHRALRDARFERLPIVAVTARASKHDMVALKAVGMAYVLTKPYRNKHLVAAIVHVLEGGPTPLL